MFYTNRLLHGISGFLRPEDSECNVSGTGHSFASISPAVTQSNHSIPNWLNMI
ncbi:1-deoxy-D-xylulose-5-phosphate synthase N-terminal domain-containing protein [Mucilaginibacter sp. P25]|uniref:1-deoxy-D-xylulose-5-phosphate synthase N-terminal domain-containing protein n=1 Tax=Mucilaginibacter TaxID=423349 RepID=UPI00115F9D76